MKAIPLIAGLVFVAELGDKSQLVALTLAARYPVRSVLTGLLIATALMHAASVTVGAAVASVLPDQAVTIAAGVAFLGFGLLTALGGDDEDHDEPRPARTRAAVPAVAGAFLAAELGDKTMLASATLAAAHGAFATWAGATTGMFAASALAVVVGGQLAARVRPVVVRTVAASSFAVIGVALLAEAVWG